MPYIEYSFHWYRLLVEPLNDGIPRQILPREVDKSWPTGYQHELFTTKFLLYARIYIFSSERYKICACVFTTHHSWLDLIMGTKYVHVFLLHIILS